MKRTNLRSQNITKRNRQLKTYGTQTPLSSAAVERGSTRWLSDSRVDIEGILNLIGRMNASGVVDVTGTLNGSGTNNFSGTNNLTGVNHLVGPTDVAGNFEIISGGQFKAGDSLIYPDGSAKFGDLGIASDGTMQAGLFELRPDGSADFGDLNISKDGVLTTGDTKIDTTGRAEFGDFIIDPASNFPIQAPGGRMVSNGTNQIGLDTTGASILLDAFSSTLVHDTTVLSLAGGIASLIGALKISSTPTGPASELTPLGIDTSGNVRRIV